MDLDPAGTGTVTLWEHLPMLVRAKSPESIEQILQTLWRTRKTGLDLADRSIISDMLNLQDDALLDPLLVCLRILIRNIAPGNLDEVGIQGLFPSEILPELRRLLTLLLLRLQRGWREDLLKDQEAPLPRFKAMKWSMSTTNEESMEPVALVKLELHNNVKLRSGDSELMFRVPKDTSTNILTSISSLREQLSGVDSFGRLHDRGKEVPKVTKLLTKLFPNKVTIHMPQDEVLLASWKHQLDRDAETLKIKGNLNNLLTVARLVLRSEVDKSIAF